jgi:hypothetical protein
VPSPFFLRRFTSFKIDGTATKGVDYQSISSIIIVSAGSTSVQIPILPVWDSDIEETETVTLGILPDAAYGVATNGANATISILDSPQLGRIKVRRRE